MILLRLLFRLALPLTAACALLTFASAALGRGLPADPLLAFVPDRMQPSICVYHMARALAPCIRVSNAPRDLAWNRDGRLLFMTDRIWVWDGAALRAVPLPPELGTLWGWSPDGRLTVTLLTDDGRPQLHLWDGQTFMPIAPDAARQTDPAWHADGRLAFVSNRDGNAEVYVWDGQTLSKVSRTFRDTSNTAPVWSPDGRLAFVTMRGGVSAEVMVWNGDDVMNVSNDPAEDDFPAWGWDGRLAFVSNRTGNADVFVWDGTRILQVTHDPAPDVNPLWLPDGRLAFVTLSGVMTVYVWDGTTTAALFDVPGEFWQFILWMP